MLNRLSVQVTSIMARLGLSMDSPLMSVVCIQGKVLMHMQVVEISTNLLIRRIIKLLIANLLRNSIFQLFCTLRSVIS